MFQAQVDPCIRRCRRLVAAFLLVLLTGGCGLFVHRATPEQLGALSPEKRERLVPYETRMVQASTAWHLATRAREIAAAELAAVEEKPEAAEALAAWGEGRALAAQRQQVQEREAEFRRCHAYYDALEAVLEAQVDAAAAQLDAAEAFETEQKRRYDLTVAELERARMAQVMGRPGILKADRDEAVGAWDERVAHAAARLTEAVVYRRQLEVRAADVRKAWIGATIELQDRFGDGCSVDWKLPEPGSDLAMPNRPLTNPIREGGLPAEEAPSSYRPVTGPGPVTAPAAESEVPQTR